jgi:hypothetical protein
MIFRLKGHASFSDPRTEDMPNTVFQCDELLDQDSVDFQRQTQIGTGDLSSTSTIVKQPNLTDDAESMARLCKYSRLTEYYFIGIRSSLQPKLRSNA